MGHSNIRPGSIGGLFYYRNSPETNLCLSAIICVDQINFRIMALVDSGTEHNLIRKNLVEQLQILVEELTSSITVAAITGQTISSIISHG